MTAATKPMGVSELFPRPPMETLFKDRYFVSGSSIGSDKGIAKWFQDQAQRPVPISEPHHLLHYQALESWPYSATGYKILKINNQ